MQEREHPRVLIPELCRLFYQLGWVTGTGGGISLRRGFVCRWFFAEHWEGLEMVTFNTWLNCDYSYLKATISEFTSSPWSSAVMPKMYFCCEDCFEYLCADKSRGRLTWGQLYHILRNVCKSGVRTEGRSFAMRKQNSNWRLWQVITNIFDLCCFGGKLQKKHHPLANPFLKWGMADIYLSGQEKLMKPQMEPSKICWRPLHVCWIWFRWKEIVT